MNKHLVLKLAMLLFLSALFSNKLLAQHTDSLPINAKTIDSAYLNETEAKKEPVKVLHAEPLYIDLIRDLGARKGEKEWNVGLGLTDNKDFDSYTALVEYEFAPINRLGLEVELPFTFYYRNNGKVPGDSIPPNRLQSVKLAGQYSFFVSDQLKTSMAIGYIHEFELSPFKGYGKGRMLTGHVYNPFFVAAKRWGNNFHSLLYTGPYMSQHHNHTLYTTWQMNTSFHYMIPGTRNFIGVEFNKELAQGDFDMTIRPQLRVSVADNLMVGIVTGVPIRRENERFSSFVRLIYEPKHKHR
ncbi:phosphoribosylformylglycinamidine synthase [Segetibacter sp. 3557_3]|uniref:HAEPLYID family protein n=1 Tax=Segetibacter sp. 3557_3 TaxID=2547429 RepID=UPI0010590CA8|nr:HAEPLYID family protein [Segetibacter sp. 3557_3]TDH24665.1 phosphoribosylformylglycinamidine synthase [Segetibacter sp. 3557_3]